MGKRSPSGAFPPRSSCVLFSFPHCAISQSSKTFSRNSTILPVHPTGTSSPLKNTARFGPSQEDYDAVIHFAEANGLAVMGTSRNRMNVDVKGSVASVEKAFHVTMGVYQHPTENRTFYAPDQEPAVDLPFQLWRIAGLDNFSIPRPLVRRRNAANVKSNATTGSGPSASFLGSDMRAAYYGGSLTGTGQSLGLLEYYGTDLADLNTYYSNVRQTNNVPITLLSTDGTSTSCVYPLCDDTEQTLDMTQALGMAPGMSSLVMYVGSSDAAIFNAMATANPLNGQLSSSWTWTPADPSTDNPYFQEFAAQGQNLFQAAGDSGAWASSSSIYPADDAFLTTVGGTDLQTQSAAGPWASETAWVDGGGGISPDGYAIPSWQTTTANGCSSCSKSLRNGPDFRLTRTSRSMYVPTKVAAPPTIMAEPVLRLLCGPATSLSSISRQLLTAIPGLASSIQPFTQSGWDRATAPHSTTSPAEVTDFRQRPDTIWRRAGAVRTARAC